MNISERLGHVKSGADAAVRARASGLPAKRTQPDRPQAAAAGGTTPWASFQSKIPKA